MTDEQKTTIRFHVSQDRYADLSVEAFVAFEDAQAGSPMPNITGLRDFCAAFMVDEAGKPLELTWARRLLGKLSVSELVHWSAELGKQLEATAVPKANGASSTVAARPSGDGSS